MNILFKPIIANDLSMWEMFQSNAGNTYCIGSIDLDRYIKVTQNKDLIFKFCKTLNGNYTINELKEMYYSQNINLNIEKMIEILCKAGLIVNCEDIPRQIHEMDKFSLKIFTINLEKSYKFLDKCNKIIFPYIFYMSIIIICVGFILTILNYNIFFNPSSYKIANSYEIGIVCIAINSMFSLLSHEFSHAIVSCKYRLKPKNITLALYLLISPIVYLKIPGIYTLPPKKRIVVWAAGIYMNLVLFCIFISLYFCSSWHNKQILFFMAIPNLISIAMNISPFMPTDGYFMLSTILKATNMRSSILQSPRNLLKTKILFKNIYIFCSVVVMLFTFLSQIFWISKELIKSYNDSPNILIFVFRIKIFILLLLLFILKKFISSKQK